MEGCVVGYGCNRSRSHALEECPPPLGGSGGALGGGADMEGCVVGYGCNRSRSHALEECPPPRGPRGVQ